MKMRDRIVLMLFAGVLLLVGCEKVSPDSLQGKWEPVYACGSYEDATYIHYFDGSVDEHGHIPTLLVGKNNPDVKYESSMLITGIRFFRQNGKDVFTTFEIDSPRKEIGKPLLYRIESGRLYRELPMGAFMNCSPDVLDEGSGEFDEGTPISFLDDGQVKIGEFTYSKK
jgi:hypothetical protein